MSQREGNLLGRTVEFRRLMRVLTITKRLHQIELQEEFLGQTGLGPHVGGNHAVVFCRMGIGLCREPQTGIARRVSVRPHLVQHDRIVSRITDNRHVAEVLRGTAQHRGPADIDILDRLGHLHPRFGYGLPERIEIHTHQIDEFYAVGPQRSHMLRHVAPCQQPAVHGRMQRLDPTVADLRKTRYIADVQYLNAMLPQQLHRAARSNHFPTQSLQALCEIDDSRLIAHTD